VIVMLIPISCYTKIIMSEITSTNELPPSLALYSSFSKLYGDSLNQFFSNYPDYVEYKESLLFGELHLAHPNHHPATMLGAAGVNLLTLRNEDGIFALTGTLLRDPEGYEPIRYPADLPEGSSFSGLVNFVALSESTPCIVAEADLMGESGVMTIREYLADLQQRGATPQALDDEQATEVLYWLKTSAVDLKEMELKAEELIENLVSS
jgi:hypothetical protein